MITDYTGKTIDVFNLKVEDISLSHIAHALSLKCRFGCCCTKLYSVAQHCIHASYEGKTPLENIYALLHDAAEAYLPDFAGPDKSKYYFCHDDLNLGERVFIPVTKLEDSILQLIFKKFDLDWRKYLYYKYSIKIIDRRLRDTEGEKFMVNWKSSTLPYDFKNFCAMGPDIVEAHFKGRLWDLQTALGMPRSELDD